MHGKTRHPKFDSQSIGIDADAKMNHNTSVRLANYKPNITNLKQFDKKEGILAYTFDHIYACNDGNAKNTVENVHINADQSEVNNTTDPKERAAAFSQLTDNFNNTITEVRHLKDLLLLHLDLIQQQSEQLLTKDKVISSLKQENDTLKSKLNRLDRRVYSKRNNLNGTNSPCQSPEQLQFQFSSLDSFLENGYCEETQNNVNSEANSVPAYNDSNTKNLALKCVNNQNASDKIKTKFNKLRLVKDNVVNNSSECNESSVIGENGGNLINKIILHKIHADYELTLNGFSHINNADDLNLGSEEIVSHKESMSPTVEIKIEGKDYSEHSNEMNQDSPNLRGGVRKRIVENNSLNPNDYESNRSNNQEVKKRVREILMTSKEYHIGVGDVEFGAEEQDVSIKDQSSILEVPRWCGQSYTSSCSVEGIENLDDSIISKRHMKWEIEEKRRKRWDVQRIREQRTIERLKSRQNRIGVTRSSGVGVLGGGMGGSGSGGGAMGGCGAGGRLSPSATAPDEQSAATTESLWPDPHDARYIVLTENLPVCALGGNLPILQPSEFSLPWSTRPPPRSPGGTLTRRPSHSGRRRRRQRRQRVKSRTKSLA